MLLVGGFRQILLGLFSRSKRLRAASRCIFVANPELVAGHWAPHVSGCFVRDDPVGIITRSQSLRDVPRCNQVGY
jgi:hypothetical protein